jgi:hypothetical protein
LVLETHPLVLRFLADKEHVLSPIRKNEVVVPVQVGRREPVIGKGLEVFLALGRVGGWKPGPEGPLHKGCSWM